MENVFNVYIDESNFFIKCLNIENKLTLINPD